MRIIFTILFLMLYQCALPQSQYVDFSRAKSYNHKLQGRQAALTNQQDTSRTPDVCGLWYEQPPDSVWCFNGFNAPFALDPNNTMWPTSVSYDLRANYNLTYAYLWVESYDGTLSADSNQLILTAGTPYVWADNLATLTANTVVGYNQWIRVPISLGHSTRYIHLETGIYMGVIRQMILVGTLIDTIANPPPATVIKPNTRGRYGTNYTLGDGKGRDFNTDTVVDYSVSSFDKVRIFGAERYYVDSPGLVLNNGGQGLNVLEAIYADKFYDYGINYWYTMAGMTVPSMVNPAFPDSGFLTFQKPISYQYGLTGRIINNIPSFNLIASNDTSYAHIAYTAKITAAAFGGRAKPMQMFEIGNEFDGKFLGSGMFLPDEMAAYCNAMYDGDEGNITYLGQSVGVKNCGNNILMAMPGLVNMNIGYFETMAFWFYWHRTDHKFAADVINAHHYDNNSGTQGQNGVGVIPEDPTFGVLPYVAPFKAFRDSLAPHALVADTETGFDAYPRRVNDTSEAFCGSSIYGNSFQNVPAPISGQTVIQTQGNMLVRDALLHYSTDIDFTCQFWLADRQIYGTTCGTFGASGTLTLDTVIAFVPYYTPRNSWYYLKTMDTILKGYEYVSQSLTVNGLDSTWKQKYRSVTNSDSLVYAIWSPTASNASSSYLLDMDESGTFTVKNCVFGSTTGQVTQTGTGASATITKTETPQFVILFATSTPSTGDILRSKNRYYND